MERLEALLPMLESEYGAAVLDTPAGVSKAETEEHPSAADFELVSLDYIVVFVIVSFGCIYI